jgi:hypothetical protein
VDGLLAIETLGVDVSDALGTALALAVERVSA